MGAPSYPARERNPAPYSGAQDALPPARSASRGDPVGVGRAGRVKPTATLACPIVSMLDRWFADSVQPAAQRWFGTRVVEIKQISAYSCRGMNGNPHAHISEHAFGNALDIAAFTLADGRRVTVKHGWHGLPEEQGFLRDIQGGACQMFNTVLAPGSNAQHDDHFHVDLMRRSSGRIICQPAAVSGDRVAARAGGRNPYAASREPNVTGSLGGRRTVVHRHKAQGQRGRRVSRTISDRDLDSAQARRLGPSWSANSQALTRRAVLPLTRRDAGDAALPQKFPVHV